MRFFNLTALALSAFASSSASESVPASENASLEDSASAELRRPRFSKADADREAWLLSYTIRPF